MAENSDTQERDRQGQVLTAALIGIAPQDETEGMIAAQLLASYNAAMKWYRRAMHGEQTFEGRRQSTLLPTVSMIISGTFLPRAQDDSA